MNFGLDFGWCSVLCASVSFVFLVGNIVWRLTKIEAQLRKLQGSAKRKKPQ